MEATKLEKKDDNVDLQLDRGVHSLKIEGEKDAVHKKCHCSIF